MLNLRTGKNDLAPVALTRRDSIKGLAAILAAGCAPAIASAAARGAARMGGMRGAAAAYDHYDGVEYLQSSGSQYIDTGWCASVDNVRIVADVVSLGGIKVIWGSETLGSFADWCMNQAGGYWYCGTKKKFTLPLDVFDGNRHSLDVSAANGVFSGMLDTTPFSVEYTGSIVNNNTGNKNLFLFGDGINGVCYNCSPGKIYSLKIVDAGVVARYFVPVVALFNGVEEGCMYDRVSGQLFRNAGTGAFTWG